MLILYLHSSLSFDTKSSQKCLVLSQNISGEKNKNKKHLDPLDMESQLGPITLLNSLYSKTNSDILPSLDA